MENRRAGVVEKHLEILFREGTLTGLDDGQLLERFAKRRDEAAFAALVERHGPMVLAACRGLLRDVHQADDVFQATFLVLARRAGVSAIPSGSVPGYTGLRAMRLPGPKGASREG